MPFTGTLPETVCPALPQGLGTECETEADLRRILYFAPVGILSGKSAEAAVLAGQGWPMANEALCFTALRLFWRQEKEILTTVAPFGTVLDWSERQGDLIACMTAHTLQALSRKHETFAGVSLHRPVVMGILNCTPDSFSDGGEALDVELAIRKGRRLLEEGADILDVGGESTRPGADPVSDEEEIHRVVPVIRALAAEGAVISVDTRHASVMDSALEAGARIINDISALEDDPQALRVIKRRNAPVILMHKQGDPQTMQADPRYDLAALDVFDYLAERIQVCRDAGIPRENLCIDPGIGFGKTVEHNLSILAHLGLYHGLGCPVLLGASRKRFIPQTCKADIPPKERLAGSLTAALTAFERGVQIVRVHDVAATCQAANVWDAIRSSG